MLNKYKNEFFINNYTNRLTIAVKICNICIVKGENIS